MRQAKSQTYINMSLTLYSHPSERAHQGKHTASKRKRPRRTQEDCKNEGSGWSLAIAAIIRIANSRFLPTSILTRTDSEAMRQTSRRKESPTLHTIPQKERIKQRAQARKANLLVQPKRPAKTPVPGGRLSAPQQTVPQIASSCPPPPPRSAQKKRCACAFSRSSGQVAKLYAPRAHETAYQPSRGKLFYTLSPRTPTASSPHAHSTYASPHQQSRPTPWYTRASRTSRQSSAAHE